MRERESEKEREKERKGEKSACTNSDTNPFGLSILSLAPIMRCTLLIETLAKENTKQKGDHKKEKQNANKNNHGDSSSLAQKKKETQVGIRSRLQN